MNPFRAGFEELLHRIRPDVDLFWNEEWQEYRSQSTNWMWRTFLAGVTCPNPPSSEHSPTGDVTATSDVTAKDTTFPTDEPAARAFSVLVQTSTEPSPKDVLLRKRRRYYQSTN